MMSVTRSTYHHGDLARALTDAAADLAAEGGPDAVVLREAARRTGVSATAAYRHFPGQLGLLGAVAARAMAGMAGSMLAAQDRVDPALNRQDRAVARWGATGEAYVRWAVDHPGLFRTAFACPLPDLPAGGGAAPYLLLCEALDECVDAGLLSPDARASADQLSWIGVHGLAVLVLDGALPGFGPPFEDLLVRTLDLLTNILDRRPH